MPPFKTRFPVRFADIDHAGIVYYPRYYHYFHVTFEEMFRDRLGARGYANLLDERKIGFPAVSTQCNYTGPLRFGDEVEISMEVAKLGQTSVTFAYSAGRAIEEAPGLAPVATAEVVFAVLDFNEFRAIPIPGDLRRLFLELLRPAQVKPDPT